MRARFCVRRQHRSELVREFDRSAALIEVIIEVFFFNHSR